VQGIADMQTMPEMRERLLVRLRDLSSVPRIRAELQALRKVALTEEEKAHKRTLWLKLRDGSFWMLTASTWLLPALTLLVHIQVTVLGRHMYLEKILRNVEGQGADGPLGGLVWRWPQGGSDKSPRLWPLSPAQQEAVVSYCAFLLHEGLPKLLPTLMQAVQEHTHRYTLSDKLTTEAVRSGAPCAVPTLCETMYTCACITKREHPDGPWLASKVWLRKSVNGGLLSEAGTCCAVLLCLAQRNARPSICTQILELLSSIHASIDKAIVGGQWADALLPPINFVSSNGASSPQQTSPVPLPDAFSIHRAVHLAEVKQRQQTSRELCTAEVLQAAAGCSFPPYFVPHGLGPVDASVVAELVLEVCFCGFCCSSRLSCIE
jgi:hypothetical protein